MHHRHQFWEVGGLGTSVYDSGPEDGRPALVLVHGGDPRSLSNALDWSSVWRPATLGARLVAYDKPGQGLSYSPDMSGSSMSADGLCAHLEELVDRLAPAPVVVVGHSRGALPAIEVARRRPDRVIGLVLVASNTLAPPSARTPQDFYPRAYADPPEHPTVEYVRREPVMNSWSTEHIDRDFIAGRMRAALHNGWWFHLAQRRAVYEETVLPSLRHLRESVLRHVEQHGAPVPVLQLWGQEDVSAPVELAHALFARLAAGAHPCSSVVLNRSGHYVYRERPEEFSSAVAAFLASLGT